MIEYTLVRSARRRTLSITVTRDAKVVVRAGLSTDKRYIEGFLSEKAQWIERTVARVKQIRARTPIIEDGALLTVCSVDYVISLYDGSRTRECLNTLYLPRADCKRHLLSFARKKFQNYAAERTAQAANAHRFIYQCVKVGTARSKWGSCTADDKIIYSLAMAFLPARLCDYVILHELCHTVHKNHGKGFYMLLSSVLKDHRQRKAELKEYGFLLDFIAEK